MSDVLLDDLKTQIAKGRCIAIVGAGVSIHSTQNAPCASWTGLLKDGVQRCEQVCSGLPAGWGDRVRSEITSGDLDDLLSAAEKISSKLGAPGGGEYGRWLSDGVGPLTASRTDVLEALRDLGVTLATTNYDGLIEEVTGLPSVTWLDRTRAERVLRGDEPAVLHLHGHWQQPESVVLGIRSYEKVLGDEHAQAMQRAMASMETLLFVGCGDGLHDPNFRALLEWTGKIFAGSHYRRFRLARDSEVAALQAKHPPEQRLFVLGYGPDFTELAPFLRGLRTGPTTASVPASGSTPGAGRPPSPSSVPASLPARPRCFGRDDEVTTLLAALLAPKPEPIPILGGPGIGKTNLALAAAHDDEVARRYGARRFFVRCDGLNMRGDLAGGIATTLGIALGGNNEAAALLELERAPALLLLDNLETTWERDTLGVEELLGRLSALSALALLVTVRGAQRPAGVAWREALSPPPLPMAAARELFLSIAGRALEGDDRLGPLLEAVDRVPLAVTLLAHLAEGEPDLEGLWGRWQQERTAMLQRAGGRERPTNLELSYQLSYDSPRMTQEGQALLRLMALLPAGLAHGDIAAVLPSGPLAAPVLRKLGLAFDEGSRLRLPAPLREFVARCHAPEAAGLGRLVTHFLELALLGDRLGADGGAEAAERLTPEAANVEAMLLGALAGDRPDDMRQKATTAARAWGEFARFTGVGSTEPLERATQAAKSDGDLRGQANCIMSLGDIAFTRSEYDAASQHYGDALTLYDQVGDLLGRANCIMSLGDIALERSESGTAYQRYVDALQLYRQVPDLLGQANCIHSLGDIALERSEYDAARRHYSAALPLYQMVGGRLGEANCIKGLADIARQRSEYSAARQRYEEALPIYREAGSLLGIANCIQGLGDIALERDAAREHFIEALAMYRTIHEPRSVGHAYRRLALIARSPEEKAEHLREARRAWEPLAMPDLLRKLDEIEAQPWSPPAAAPRTEKE